MFSPFRSTSADRPSAGRAKAGRASRFPVRPFAAAATVLVSVFLVAAAAQNRGDAVVASITPLVPFATNPAEVALGERLFADRRLSGRQDRSCGTCHDLARGGVNPDIRIPAGGPHEGFDTLTVFNAALNYRFDWLSEHRTLAESNEQSILSPDIMDGNWDAVLARLRADPSYAEAFAELYGDDWGSASVLEALAEFQRSLVTPDSRFDRYLRGDEDAITAEEERGFRLFEGLGCVSCHQGRNVGGNLVQRFGIFAGRDEGGRAAVGKADLGRFAITGEERDRSVFRVPSLRNVAVTAPYLHDGSVDTLEAVVAIMARTQLGRQLAGDEIGAVTAFLHTLTGQYRGAPLGPSRPDASR